MFQKLSYLSLNLDHSAINEAKINFEDQFQKLEIKAEHPRASDQVSLALNFVITGGRANLFDIGKCFKI